MPWPPPGRAAMMGAAMMEGRRVHLETLVDALGYERTGGEFPAYATANEKVAAVLTTGETIEAMADAIIWQDVYAAKPANDNSMKIARCPHCGSGFLPATVFVREGVTYVETTPSDCLQCGGEEGDLDFWEDDCEYDEE